MLAQHTPVQLLGLVGAAFLLVLGRERHHPPLGRQRVAAPEGLIGFGAPPQDRQRLAEHEPRVLELRIEMRRSLEEGQCLAGPALLDEEVTQILVRSGERRRPLDHLAEQRLGLGGAFQLDEQRAQQRLQVDVARVIGEPSADARLGAGEIIGVDRRDRCVDVGFRGHQRHR